MVGLFLGWLFVVWVLFVVWGLFVVGCGLVDVLMVVAFLYCYYELYFMLVITNCCVEFCYTLGDCFVLWFSLFVMVNCFVVLVWLFWVWF